jgi:hypothetical protein
VQTWFNPCAFGVPSGAFGNLGRNAFRGKSVFNTDLSLFKTVPLNERMQLQLRMEAFNVFNVQNWDVPSALTLNTGNPTGSTLPPNSSIAAGVGRITALAQGTTPRQIQFGIRFVF